MFCFFVFFLTDDCVEKWQDANSGYKHYTKYNNRADCEANDGEWLPLHNFLERTSIPTEALCIAENAKAANVANNITYIWARPLV